MAFNITVVAFGKEPDMSSETLLGYRGFDAELVGKETHSTTSIFGTTTQEPGVMVAHARFNDDHVDSPNLIVIFENALPEGATSSDDMSIEMMDKTVNVFKEILHRVKCFDTDRIEGPFIYGTTLGYCILNVRDELSKDLANAMRKQFKSV